MSYVDGFVVPVDKDRVDEYRKIARRFGKKCMELGAIQYMESSEDDVPPGKVTSFDLAVRKAASEVVFFSFIIYPNKRTRDRINKAMMSDPEWANMDMTKAPMNGKTMIFGGFKPLVSLGG